MGWNDPLPSLFCTSSVKVKHINFLSGRSVVGAIGLPRRWISRDFCNVTAWLVLVSTKSSLWKGCSGEKAAKTSEKWLNLKQKKVILFSLGRTRSFWFLMLLLGTQWAKGRDQQGEVGRIVPCYGFLLHKSKFCTPSQAFLFPGYRSSGWREVLGMERKVLHPALRMIC